MSRITLGATAVPQASTASSSPRSYAWQAPGSTRTVRRRPAGSSASGGRCRLRRRRGGVEVGVRARSSCLTKLSSFSASHRHAGVAAATARPASPKSLFEPCILLSISSIGFPERRKVESRRVWGLEQTAWLSGYAVAPFESPCSREDHQIASGDSADPFLHGAAGWRHAAAPCTRPLKQPCADASEAIEFASGRVVSIKSMH